MYQVGGAKLPPDLQLSLKSCMKQDPVKQKPQQLMIILLNLYTVPCKEFSNVRHLEFPCENKHKNPLMIVRAEQSL